MGIMTPGVIVLFASRVAREWFYVFYIAIDFIFRSFKDFHRKYSYEKNVSPFGTIEIFQILTAFNSLFKLNNDNCSKLLGRKSVVIKDSVVKSRTNPRLMIGS